MIPHLLKLLLEKGNIFPSESIVKLVEKESIFAIAKFIDVLVDLAFDPNEENNVLRSESNALIETIINSSVAFEMLRHIFSLQGPPKDQKFKTIQGNKFIKALPQWKQNAFDFLIRRISSKNGGIRQLMLTIMDMLGSERNQKVAGEIAKCICRPPSNMSSKDELDNHYRQLSVQIIDLLQISNLKKILRMTSEDKDEHSQYLRFSHCVALECVHLCIRINKQCAQKYLLDVLFVEFNTILDSDSLDSIDESQMVILNSEKMIEVLNLHYSLLSTLSPCLYIQQLLRSYSQIYMEIILVMINKECNFATISNQIVVRLIELLHGSSGDILRYLKFLAQLESYDNKTRIHRRLMIRRCLDGENVEVAMRDTYLENSYDGLSPSEDLNNVLVKILQCLPKALKDDVVSKFFICLLESRFSQHESLSLDNILPKNNELRIMVSQYSDHLLSLLCSEMEANCFTKSIDIFKLAQIVIERYNQDNVVTKCNKDIEKRKETMNENLTYALSMVVCVLERGKLSSEEKVIFDEMFPILQRLRDSHPLEKTRDLITDISIVIATHGHVNYMTKDAILEEFDDDTMDSELKEALSDVASEEIPLQGHGLLVIYKLLKSRNESTLKNRNKIFNILSQLLFHSDSFIYLRVISALSVIGDQYTEKMLPMLAQKVRSCRGNHSLLPGIKENSSLEDWMKLNEVFMRIIRNLGETAPMYRDIILSALLPGLRDEDDVVRASSLSSLAELCSQHDFLLTSVIYEVASNICHALVNDRSALVKKAAALAIKRMLLGTNEFEPRPQIMQLFPGDVLLSIYRSLKTALDRESDPEVIDHVSAAYNSLDESVRMFVFPPANPTVHKTIKILDLFQ